MQIYDWDKSQNRCAVPSPVQLAYLQNETQFVLTGDLRSLRWFSWMWLHTAVTQSAVNYRYGAEEAKKNKKNQEASLWWGSRSWQSILRLAVMHGNITLWVTLQVLIWSNKRRTSKINGALVLASKHIIPNRAWMTREKQEDDTCKNKCDILLHTKPEREAWTKCKQRRPGVTRSTSENSSERGSGEK